MEEICRYAKRSSDQCSSCHCGSNPVFTYYISFRRAGDYERAEKILRKYGKVGRKTSKYLSISTSMKLNQVKNAVRSDMKLNENDLEVMKDTFLS